MAVATLKMFLRKYEANLAGKSIDRFGINCPLRHIRSSRKHVNFWSEDIFGDFRKILPGHPSYALTASSECIRNEACQQVTMQRRGSTKEPFV